MAVAVQSTSSGPSNSASTAAVTRPSILQKTRPMTAAAARTLSTKFVIDWNNATATTATATATTASNKIKSNEDSLQEAFRQFRQQRMEEIRKEKSVTVKRKKKIRRSNPARMYRLRLKFVEQAKRYIGVPYAKKYFEPGTPEYESKLFLDCCGLVRRVMYDLAKDFGFVIGPWNQSYMFDTLPKTITHLSDVQPGDLVFITATYYNEKMKKQRHNLTHVEIMLGDGEKTIGARWNNGTVQFFDSYKFESKSYHSQIYTIKSLDHWLKGICKSYCSEHSWRRRRPIKVDKKSIFYSPDSTHSRVLSGKSSKGTTGSQSSTTNLSTKKTSHRRKRRRRGARSKSRKRSCSARDATRNEVLTPNNDEQTPTASTLGTHSINDNNVPVVVVVDDDDEEEDDDSVDIIGNQLAALNCQDDQEQCDDSDSLDEALDAEHLDNENSCM